jgi:hypothetical protein
VGGKQLLLYILDHFLLPDVVKMSRELISNAALCSQSFLSCMRFSAAQARLRAPSRLLPHASASGRSPHTAAWQFQHPWASWIVVLDAPVQAVIAQIVSLFVLLGNNSL